MKYNNRKIKMRIAIIGAGVSGMTAAHLLRDSHDVTIYESDSRPGGLIKCDRVEGCLFHTCGGHVFNSKRQDVLNWFWSRFLRDEEFTKVDRNSVVFLPWGGVIPYPIENHVHLLDAELQKRFITDLVTIICNAGKVPQNFEEFLRGRFGDTLYEIYFQPYNEKVWQRDLRQIPMSWLEGKLPMPTVEEMIYNNFNHVKEKQFVHSTFWYECNGGSQFLANRLAEGLNIAYNSEIDNIMRSGDRWIVAGKECDTVIYTGNIKQMLKSINGIDLSEYADKVEALEYHGTTSVFCEIDANPYSWIYLPSNEYKAHRIICTGNFSPANNTKGRMTGTVEFTDAISEDDIRKNLNRIPLHPRYITHKYNEFTYPIQDSETRLMIQQIKYKLAPEKFYFTGRFADWEYYNMDVAMHAAMQICTVI